MTKKKNQIKGSGVVVYPEKVPGCREDFKNYFRYRSGSIKASRVAERRALWHLAIYLIRERLSDLEVFYLKKKKKKEFI